MKFAADPLPLRIDDGGAVRVGETRVTLHAVLTAYTHGESAEQIAAAYPTLDLADVHATIAYYLRHRAELDAFLAQQTEAAEAFQKQYQAQFPQTELRERIRARRAEMEPR